MVDEHDNNPQHVTKHIFVTSGVVSSLAKALRHLLWDASRGLHVLQQKLDPYINVDPGTMKSVPAW